MEEEAREILKSALTENRESRNLVDAIRRRVAPFGGIELTLPKRQPMRRPPNFE